jgi:hypothetical protein
MFKQQNPKIVSIRRDLRGNLPDEWLEEIISILEYQLTYQTIDELSTNDLLKLRLGAGFSPVLNQLLSQAIAPPPPAVEPPIARHKAFAYPGQ